MIKIESIDKESLQDGPATPAIVRQRAFKDNDVVILRSHTKPGAVSGWHHHGHYHVYGYMASGKFRFEYGPGGNETTNVEEGGFFHVPPLTIHRDVNPSQTEGQEIILFLKGEGETVINVDGPDSADS